MSMYVEGLDMDSFDNSKSVSQNNIEQLASEMTTVEEKQMELKSKLISYILESLHRQSSAMQKATRKNKNSKSSEISLPNAANSATPAAAADTKETVSVGATNSTGATSTSTGSTDMKQFLKDLTNLEKLLKWQQANSMNLSKQMQILEFIENFAKKYGAKAEKYISKDLVTTLLKNLVAEQFMKGGNINDEINKLSSLLNQGPDFLKKIMDSFKNGQYGKIDYYKNTYEKDGKKIDNDSFNIIAGGDLAFTSMSIIPSIIKAIYQEKLKELEATCKNPFMFYMALLSIIGDKENDTEEEVNGTANILQQLANGENKTGDATNALSVLINMITGNKKTNDEVIKIYDLIKGNGGTKGDAAAQDLKDLINANGGDNFDVNKLSTKEKKELLDDVSSLSKNPKFKTELKDIDFQTIISNLSANTDILTQNIKSLFDKIENNLSEFPANSPERKAALDIQNIINKAGGKNLDLDKLSTSDRQKLINDFKTLSTSKNTDIQNLLKDTDFDQLIDGVFNDKLLNAKMQNIYQLIKNNSEKLYWNDPADRKAIQIIMSIFNSYGGAKFDINKLKSTDKADLIKCLKQLSSSKNPTAQKVFQNADLQDIINKLSSSDTSNPLPQVQTLAQALLFIKTMGDHLNDSIFSGLKSITDKLLGPNGDLYKLTDITEDDLQKAANGDSAAEQKVKEGFQKLVSTDPDKDSSSLSTINNELNQVTTYFNDHNSSEQSQAQFISSNDQKMLSFMKQMYDMPIKLVASIMQNLAKASS